MFVAKQVVIAFAVFTPDHSRRRMFTSSIFWLWFAGLLYLGAGLFVVRRELASAGGLERWIVLGPCFVAAPLAVFAAEHFVDAGGMQSMVPVSLPSRLFWIYFVGCAWIAAATSLVLMKFVRVSATLLGAMLLIIVLTIHLPNALKHPANPLAWSLLLRETTFAGGAWALAGTGIGTGNRERRNWMVLFGRFALAITIIYFGVEHLLRAQILPGVPDAKATPVWVPLHAVWGYPVGLFLLIAGTALLCNIKPRLSAAWIGVLMTVLTVILYVPILAVMRDSSQMTEGINYVADTLMFGGTALLVARAMPLHGLVRAGFRHAAAWSDPKSLQSK